MNISSYIFELQSTVITASSNYEIWWVYIGGETRRLYIDDMNDYVDFFRSSIHAHFVATVIALYRLYESRNDTYNIPRFLYHCREKKLLDDTVIKNFEIEVRSVKPIWKKVNILRNKAFAHRTQELSLDDVFSEAGITPNQIRDLIENSKFFLNKLSTELGLETHAFNLSTKGSVIALLETLKRDRNATL